MDLIENWKEFYEDRGIDPVLADSYLQYADRLIRRGVPVIFEIEHLSKLLGIKLQELCKMISSPEHFYRVFQIKKRRGGFRTIQAPYPSLLHCQKWIHENILRYGRVNMAAHGFQRFKSILSNAQPHLGSKMLLKMDLKDFFPSIPISWVINYFHSLGYAKNVSYSLASLCCLNDALVQGSATSPSLSNLLLVSLDRRLSRLAFKFKLTYTRYADDLTFSGDSIPIEFPNIVDSIVDDFGLKVNREKTRLHRKRGQRIVTGISTAGDSPKLPRVTVRHLRKELYFIKKFGLISHLSNEKINEAYYLSSLIGKFSFWLQVEPDNSFAQEGISFLKSLQNHQF